MEALRTYRPKVLKAWHASKAYLPFYVLGAAAVGMLLQVFAYRLSYPLDLEWMEGGTLIHALRVLQGKPLYAPPSVEFISFLYTPLYPLVLAAFGKVFSLGYFLGRLVSALSFTAALVVLWLAVFDLGRFWHLRASESHRAALRALADHRAQAGAAGLLACGAVALAYPFCGQWYDLVRADSLWLALVSGGLFFLRPHTDTAGKPLPFGRVWKQTVAGSLLLVAAFFTKQTAAPFIVAAAVALLLTTGWKNSVLFCALTGGLIALLVLLAQHASDGWFWIYIYRLHQSHALLWEKLWPTTPKKLFDHGFLLWLVGTGWLVAAALRRHFSRKMFFWFLMAGCGLITAAVGSATQGAYKNAYIPGVFFGALWAAGAAVEIYALLSVRPHHATSTQKQLKSSTTQRRWISAATALLAPVLLSAHLFVRWFDPTPLVPSVDMEHQARRHIAYLKTLGPAVFVPYHPFENVLAGGRGHLHIMGINDIYTWAKNITDDRQTDRRIKRALRRSIRRSFARRRWSAVIHDRTYTHQLFGLRIYYRRTEDLARGDRAPPMLTGNPCRPRWVWRPKNPP